MILLWSVELVPETLVRSTLLVNWPAALGPGLIPIECFPLSLAKSRSNCFLGWLHERARGGEDARKKGLHTHVLELFTPNVNQQMRPVSILEYCPQREDTPFPGCSLQQRREVRDWPMSLAQGWNLSSFLTAKPMSLLQSKAASFKNQGVGRTDLGNSRRWLFISHQQATPNKM